MDLRDRVAIVTGGRRIGRTVARGLADRGADLVLSYRGSREEAEETAAGIRGAGRRALVVAADVSRPTDCDALVAAAAGTFGRVDVLVNMASIYRSLAFDLLTPAEWEANLAVNLSSAFHCAHAAVPHMRRAGGGRIINFADWLAASGRPQYRGFVPYYVAKAGIIALTEALALELAGDAILVNAIAPGPIVAPPDLSEEESREVTEATPLRRWGGEEEILKAVLLLVDSDFMTGETIRVDGGRHVR
jgi:NAD(P)-dependent dehydrogenase (short-subunit alcohol dehydrogenase family)